MRIFAAECDRKRDLRELKKRSTLELDSSLILAEIYKFRKKERISHIICFRLHLHVCEPRIRSCSDRPSGSAVKKKSIEGFRCSDLNARVEEDNWQLDENFHPTRSMIDYDETVIKYGNTEIP